MRMANLESIARLAELDGVLLVDKPVNISSHDLIKAVKQYFNLVKVGHGGTLDPNATGLLVVLLGNATRLSADLMGSDRTYSGVLRLGRDTNTFDREGETVAEKPFDGVTRERFDEVVRKEFLGDSFQKPPAFSVIKMPAHPTYDIVRTAGRPPRPRVPLRGDRLRPAARGVRDVLHERHDAARPRARHRPGARVRRLARRAAPHALRQVLDRKRHRLHGPAQA